MTEQQFRIRAIENVKQMINHISNKAYSRLHAITNVDSSWCNNDGETQIEGIKEFAEWLEDNWKCGLKMNTKKS